MAPDEPLRDVGVGSWIERRARIAPERLAVIAGDRSYSYVELAARIRRLTNALRQLGVARNDRVAWLGPNHPAFLESLFACGLLGAVLAPINHRLGPDEVQQILEDTEPSALIQHRTAPATVPSSVRHRIDVEGPSPSWRDYEAIIAESPEDAIDAAIRMDDLCLLPHTSGTTGSPKGVMLTHGNITWNVVNFLTCADFRGDDVTVAIAPFFRVGGTGVNVLPVLFLGGTVVVPTDPTPQEVLDLIERHRVTVGFGNPDLLDALARAPGWPDTDLSSIRFIVTGGAPVPERLIRAYLDRGVTLLQGYGLSEAAPLVLLLDPQHALDEIGSAGRPALLVEVRIEGTSGASAPAGETGELLVRGPNVMAGYWNRPEATREAITADGWLRSGDAARMDDRGFVWIVDRVADGFTSDGHRVYPGDVERVLGGHPAVEEAAVADVADESRGQVGVAFVVLAEGAQATEPELLAYCRDRLASHQVPLSVTFTERLPRNSVGKLIRSQLRAQASSVPRARG